MGEERRFRSHFQVVGERRRQRIHDDRRLYRTRSPAQCWRSKKNGAQAIGRSRGGLTTKIHALVDALGNPVELMLTPGQAHDLACAEPLIEDANPDALIGDKAYDSDPFVDVLTQREITPVIPPKSNRKTPRACDFALYRERNLVERFFNQLKHFRAIATRYDKLARNFLAGVQLAAITILLNRIQALVCLRFFLKKDLHKRRSKAVGRYASSCTTIGRRISSCSIRPTDTAKKAITSGAIIGMY